MKNWKKWLVAGCMAALLGIGTMGTTAMAMGGGGVDRSEAVAEEEKVPSGKATQNSRVSSKAWKKINGVCYNGSGQKLEGAVTRGIDVSEWQDTINWSQVKKSNVDFAFVRISYGLNHLDKTYDYIKYPIRWFMTLNMIRCAIFPHHRSQIWQRPSAMR